jgi:predicted DNA-binding protein YlxM (UPF0122 family)
MEHTLPPVHHIAKMMEHGFTIKEIADDYGVLVQAVYQKLRRAGVDLPPRPRTRHKLPDDKTIIKLFYAGKTKAEIARQYNCSRQAVEAIVKKYNLGHYGRGEET